MRHEGATGKDSGQVADDLVERGRTREHGGIDAVDVRGARTATGVDEGLPLLDDGAVETHGHHADLDDAGAPGRRKPGGLQVEHGEAGGRRGRCCGSWGLPEGGHGSLRGRWSTRSMVRPTCDSLGHPLRSTRGTASWPPLRPTSGGCPSCGPLRVHRAAVNR